MKGTLVRQAAESSYKLTEARLGGQLTRQDINIEQVPDLAPCLDFQDISILQWCSPSNHCMVTAESLTVQSNTMLYTVSCCGTSPVFDAPESATSVLV